MFFILYSLTFVIGVQANCNKIEFYWKWTTRKLAFYLALTNFIMLGISNKLNVCKRKWTHSFYTYLSPLISNWTPRLETLSKSSNETMKIAPAPTLTTWKLNIENRVIWLEIRTKILLGGANSSQGQEGFNSISHLSHGHRYYLLINDKKLG